MSKFFRFSTHCLGEKCHNLILQIVLLLITLRIENRYFSISDNRQVSNSKGLLKKNNTMEHSKKITSSLAEVSTLVSKLQSGNLQMTELEELVGHSRDLYELALVLRYKAYEAHVEAKDSSSKADEAPTVIVQNIEVNNTFELNVEEQDIVFPESIDFSSLDEVEEAPAAPIDLFETPASKEESEIIDNDLAAIEATETIEELLEEPIRTFSEQLESASGSEDNEFIKKFSAFDSALQSRIAMSRIDTLKGSFGLNERLQFINELFDGSSEAFSEAIKTIDEQQNELEALKRTSSFATKYQWDNESDTVEEFVLKIKRRYA